MIRAWIALREWLEVRARIREERQFHLERTAADLRTRGVPKREAKRTARARFGGRGNARLARQVLGGDLQGLQRAIQANRVPASAWLRPALLLAAMAAIFALSRDPREIANGMTVRLRRLHYPGEVALSVEGRSPWSGGGITAREFGELRTMRTLTDVGRYEGLYARAKLVPPATLAEAQAEVRAGTGEPFAMTSIAERTDVAVGPAQIVWITLGLYGLYRLLRSAARPLRRRWFWYGLAVGCLNAGASMAAFALAMDRRPEGAETAVLFSALIVVAAMQGRCWWRDLQRRCPMCLDWLVLPLTEGAADRVLLEPHVTESVCAHGHGVLVESRWDRRFRPDESPLRELIHS